MDPVAHTFTGAAFAASGLRRATPLATAALILGANVPDVDALVLFAGGFRELAFRRGWTHGVLALALWPFLLTAVLLLWDRWFRRRRNSSLEPARAGPLIALSALAVITHPTLDWLNNYGLRWLMPFDGRWFYGDALFVIDPWVWLMLGGILFLTYSNTRLALARWTVFWSLASLLLLLNAMIVPLSARIVWSAALSILVALRVLRARRIHDTRTLELGARVALCLFAVYAVGAVAASSASRSHVREALAAAGVSGVDRVMVAPVPANPFAGDVVASTADTYYVGNWNWLAQPHFQLADRIVRPSGAVFEAAARTPEAQDFLKWARFPYIEMQRTSEGSIVRFLDARYRSTVRLRGPIVRLGPDAQVLTRQ